MPIKSIVVMQPYIFPYIGYFQLFRAAGLFIYHDDVQYVKGGWINRNRILLDGHPVWMTFPVSKAPYHFPINRRFFLDNNIRDLRKILARIRNYYFRAPQFSKIYPLIEDIILTNKKNIADFAEFSNRKILDYLDIQVESMRSSDINHDCNLKGQNKVIEIVLRLKGKHFINAIGGTNLYAHKEFAEQGIDLSFLKSKAQPYKQFNERFIPNLSIIDVLMFNTREQIRDRLDQFELFSEENLRVG